MRRPVLVKYTSPVSSFEPLFGADQREAHYRSSPRDFRPPFPLISLPAFGPGGSCQGRACFWRGLRTLDNFHPVRKIKVEGKGAGGLRGLAPLAEFEAEPHRRAVFARPRWSTPATCSISDSFSFRTPRSTSPLRLVFPSACSSPGFHSHSRCLPWDSVQDKVLRVIGRGAAISAAVFTTTETQNAVTPLTRQIKPS